MVQQALQSSGLYGAAGASEWLWVDGELRPWSEVTIPLVQATWSGLSTVFEGIKGYRAPDGRLHIFALDAHLRRFQDSIAFMRMESPFSNEDLTKAVVDSLRVNNIRDDCYIQPVAMPHVPVDGFYAPPVLNARPRVFIPVGPRPSSLGTDRAQHCNITSWTRVSDRSMPPRIKAVPNYQNSRIAHLDSLTNGYNSPIFLNDRGTVAEGPGSCIAMIRHGKFVTPPVTAGILESVTRTFLMHMVPEVLGIEVMEREIDRSELYVAQEVFFMGTGAEINPIVSIDRYRIGSGEIGPVTRAIAKAYHDVVRAIDPRFAEWRTLMG